MEKGVQDYARAYGAPKPLMLAGAFGVTMALALAMLTKLRKAGKI